MRIRFPALFVFLIVYCSNLMAGEKQWYFELIPETTYGTFTHSDTLESSASNTITATLSYLDHTHIFIKARNNTLTLTDNSLSKQNNLSLGFSKFSYVDAILGITTFSLFTTHVSGNDVSDVTVTAPSVGYTNYKGTISLDFNYAYSSYKRTGGASGNTKLAVQQYTTKIGFKPIISNTWISLKNDTISFQKDTNHSQTIAFYWYPKSYSQLVPNSFLVSTLLNKRRYAVEHDTLLLYNVDDEQVSSYSFTTTWNVSDNWYLSGTIGTENYHTIDTLKLYSYNYLNINILVNW